MTESAQKKLASMKKTGKALRIISLVFSLVAVAMLIMYLLAPAANLYLEGSDSKYGRTGGYNYYGWQLSVYGCGYPPVSALAMFENSTMLAGDYVPTAHDFNTNMTLLYAIVLPILALIICGIVAGKMKNRGKAVCEFIVAGFFIYAAIVLANCVSLSIPMATNSGTTPFRSTYLMPAVNAGTYTTCIYPIILRVCFIIFAVVKAGRGVFLIYQRSFAMKNK